MACGRRQGQFHQRRPGALSQFRYQRAASLAEAATLLATPGTQAMGGGTDLLVCIDEGIASPSSVVDLRGIRGADEITLDATGALRLGATARVHDIAHHTLVAEHFPALAQACESVGSPALRHMGTIGGNLCQRPHCWYFRRGISCLKNGGDSCPARDGENRYLAILEGDPCWIVHPSDPAVALTALGALVEITNAAGTRTMLLSEFYVLPSSRLDQETVLRPGEIVSAVTVPAVSAGGRQFYRKLMQREAWDFALVSIAAVRHDRDVRIVLGGVAPRPWVVPGSVLEDVASGGLDEDSIGALADRALYDAQPLSKNGYKVKVAASLLRDAIRELT